MSEIERREIYTLRMKLDEVIKQCDEAREAARKMLDNFACHDEACGCWKRYTREYPRLAEETK